MCGQLLKCGIEKCLVGSRKEGGKQGARKRDFVGSGTNKISNKQGKATPSTRLTTTAAAAATAAITIIGE